MGGGAGEDFFGDFGDVENLAGRDDLEIASPLLGNSGGFEFVPDPIEAAGEAGDGVFGDADPSSAGGGDIFAAAADEDVEGFVCGIPGCQAIDSSPAFLEANLPCLTAISSATIAIAIS